MAGDLGDLAEAALEVASAVGDLVDADRRRKRWKGCLILVGILAAIALFYALLPG